MLLLDLSPIHHPHLLLVVLFLISCSSLMILTSFYNHLSLFLLKFLELILRTLSFQNFTTFQRPWMLKTLMSMVWLMFLIPNLFLSTLMLLQWFFLLVPTLISLFLSNHDVITLVPSHLVNFNVVVTIISCLPMFNVITTSHAIDFDSTPNELCSKFHIDVEENWISWQTC